MERVINPGLFRHSCTIQQKTVSSRNTRGEDVYTWTSYQALDMEVRALNNREVYANAQTWPNAQAMLTGPHVPGVTTAMRVHDKCCSRYFDIKQASDPDGRKAYIQLLGQEVTA